MKIDPTQFVTVKDSIEIVLDFLPYPFLVAELRDDVYHNTYVNKKFQQEIGYACEEIPTIDEWFTAAYPDPKYREEVMKGWTQRYHSAKRNGHDFVLMKVMIHTKHNQNLWYEVKSSVFGSVQLVAFVNIHEDVMKEQALKRLSDNRNQTLSILTHDIRTPLNNLHSMSQLLLKDHITKTEFIGIVSNINHESFKVLEFVNTALHWTKANFDRIAVSVSKVDVKEIAAQIVGVYENVASRKKLSIVFDLQGSEIETDPEILKIVVRNLFSNAIKFSHPEGQIFIEGSLEGERKYITIRDTGVGMKKEHLDAIFSDRYVSTTGTEKEKGLGVGLKLCLQLISQMGAKLSIESAPGKGTAATLLFNA